MLKQNASNLITCIDTSLRETPATRLIESIQMPLKTQMITFRSDKTKLDQKSIEKHAMDSVNNKKLFSFIKYQVEKPVNTQVKVKIMDIRWLLRGKRRLRKKSSVGRRRTRAPGQTQLRLGHGYQEAGYGV